MFHEIKSKKWHPQFSHYWGDQKWKTLKISLVLDLKIVKSRRKLYVYQHLSVHRCLDPIKVAKCNKYLTNISGIWKWCKKYFNICSMRNEWHFATLKSMKMWSLTWCWGWREGEISISITFHSCYHHPCNRYSIFIPFGAKNVMISAQAPECDEMRSQLIEQICQIWERQRERDPVRESQRHSLGLSRALSGIFWLSLALSGSL